MASLAEAGCWFLIRTNFIIFVVATTLLFTIITANFSPTTYYSTVEAFTTSTSYSPSSSKRQRKKSLTNSFHKQQQQQLQQPRVLSSLIVKSIKDEENEYNEQQQHTTINIKNNIMNNQKKRLVLIGGGHAHAQVIKAYNASFTTPNNLEVILIDVQKSASYSGMVPGCVSGLYKPSDTLLDLQALADWSSIEFINSKVVDIDLKSKLIYLDDNDDDDSNNDKPINIQKFDVVSLDIGSTSRNLDSIKGASQYTIPTRPISKLVQRMEDETYDLVQQQKKKKTSSSNSIDNDSNIIKVVVIGGGAAGIELAMSIHGRWNLLEDDKENIQVTILDGGFQLLPYESSTNRQALVDLLKSKNIVIKHGCQVQEIYQDSMKVNIKKDDDVGGDDDENTIIDSIDIPYTHCIWATGAGPHNLALKLANQGLATTDQGWIRVNDQFQSLSHPYVFAAGDCCNLEGLPDGRSIPKAGVFAVRAGPVLIENLSKMLLTEEEEGNNKKSELISYQPQDDFLKLLVCGDGKAIGFRFGIAFQGKWVFEMKNEIDQSFMDLFRAEKLPQPKPTKVSKQMDKSQYDANFKDKPPRLSAKDAAQLIQRTDDDVDFRLAWSTLREMAGDDNYRLDVLDSMKEKIPAVKA